MAFQERQLAAIESVSARASRATRGIAAAVIIPAVLLVPALYLAFREIQFALFGINFTYLSGGLAMVLTLGPGIPLARVLSAATVRARRSAWIDQAALEHGVPPEQIAPFFEKWHG